MKLIDWYIAKQFFWNFLVLFVLLFVFAASIDLILNLDRFVEAAREAMGEEANTWDTALTFMRFVFDFEGPRIFQFYAYLHGFVSIGAMGFTLAQMYRHKELVAILASGTSLHRIVMPFVAVIFILSMGQLMNQEFVLPNVATMLLRKHGEIGRETVDEFNIRFISDSTGTLLQAPSYDPENQTLSRPTILVRDELGRTTRRITSDEATWDDPLQGWRLINGDSIMLSLPGDEDTSTRASLHTPIDFWPTDLSPEVLTVHHYTEFAAMLSLRQIGRMLKAHGITDRNTLLRHRYARFSTVLVNVLVLIIALPSFLLREPANLMLQAARCAAVSITAMIGSAVFMMVQLPGISPAVGVFLPVVILFPIALGRITYIRT